MRRQQTKHGNRGWLIIDEDAPLPPGRDLAPQDERPIVGLIETIRFKYLRDSLLDRFPGFKYRGNDGSVSSGADHVARCLITQQ